MATYRVTVGDKDYQVEIEDVNAQPVRAVVNGRVVQVWVAQREPATDPQGAFGSGRTSPQPPPARAATPAASAVALPPPRTPPPAAGNGQAIRAPMPGSIVSVAVQAGDRVEVGQDVCVLEAMKMNNRIRAPRAGTVAQVHVSPGQQVQHGHLLVTYDD